MAIQTIQGGVYIPEPRFTFLSGVPTFGASTIDAADEGVAAMIRIPKTGNVSKVLWATRTVTTGATITVRGETWAETTPPSAFPSGTLYHANFTGTSVIADANDNIAVLTTLAAAVAVTIGDKVAILIKQPNTSFGNMQVARFGDVTMAFPYTTLNTGVSPAVSWAANDESPVIALEYDDGSYEYIPGCFPCHAINSTAFANTSTPDERGLYFKLAFPARVAGWWAWLDADGDFNANLYDSDGATKLVSTPYAVDKDARGQVTANIQFHRFAAKATLAKDTFYRFVLEPTSATNISMYDFDVNTAAVMDAHEGGQNFHYTSAKDPNEESDWTQVTTKRPFMGLLLDGFDDGAGAGGGVGSLIAGGLIH